MVKEIETEEDEGRDIRKHCFLQKKKAGTYMY